MSHPQRKIVQEKVARLRKLRLEMVKSFDDIERSVVREAETTLRTIAGYKSKADVGAFLASAATGLFKLVKQGHKAAVSTGKELERINREALKGAASGVAGKAHGASSFLLDIEEANAWEAFALGFMSPSFWFEIFGMRGSTMSVEQLKSKTINRIRQQRAGSLKLLDDRIRMGEKLLNAIDRGIDITRLA